ncbi:MAG: sulfatase-like hydrolase/transferase, partial [Gammaproteobacteria bacterium]|nr:sulfatase-like hydrolase/transferase [Gammaproteobacteria bacterium]
MQKKQPNILLIFVDNQPANMLGCAGNTEIHTPHLDALAKHAVRFSEAYCPNAMCSPCRASVLTGLMPSQHGVHTWLDDSTIADWPKNWNALQELSTLPDLLSQAGYDTALMGKYHLGIADTPQNGFKEWVTLQVGHVQSFYDNEMIVNDEHITYPGHSVDFFSDQAVDYINQRDQNTENPFFMFLTYPAPYGHWPSIKGEAINEFAKLYKETPFHSVPREAVSKELIDWLLVRKEKMSDYHDPDEINCMPQLLNDLPTLRNYYSQMSVVDNGVGRVLTALDEQGITDDTLVIYTSDHGMSLGQHGFWGHGEDTWPSNTHREANNIPLIIRPPGERCEAKVQQSLVGTTDIFGTILDYAGLPSPSPATMHSRSIRSLIENEKPEWSNTVFMEQEETRAIRTPEFLLMRRYGPTSYNFKDELYDLRVDPDERQNVIDKAEYKTDLEGLVAQLNTFFDTYSNPKWNLWAGGTAKGNSTRPFLWREAWG